MPTQLRICPLSMKVLQPSALVATDGKPAEQTLLFCNCVGAACQFWQFEAGADPRDGECALVIQAQASSLTAHLMGRMFGAAAQEATGAPAPTGSEPPSA